MKFWEKINRETVFGPGGYAEISKIAYPLILMNASHAIMQFTDRKFLAMHSSLDVAAAMPSGILYFTIFCFFMVMINFSSPIIAHLHGAGEKKETVRAAWSGFYLALAAALFILFVSPTLGKWIINSSKHDPALVRLELQYFDGLMFSGIFVCMAGGFFSFFNGRGLTKPTAVISIIGCLLNVGLDYALIFGKWGFPEMGIYGAGIATTACSGFSFFAVFILFLCQKQNEYPTRKIPAPKMEYITKLFKFGTPSGLQCLFDVGSFTFVTFSIGKYLGNEALAGSVIALAINNLMFVPMLGLSDSASIVTGHAIGRGQKHLVEKIAYRVWRVAILYMAAGAFFYLFFPKMLVMFFAPSQLETGVNFEQVVEISCWVLRFAVIFNFSDCFKFVFIGVLRGAGDTRAVFAIATGCAVGILIPICWIFTEHIKTPVVPFWGYLTVYYIVEAVLFYWRFNSGKWKKIKLIEHPESEIPLEELTVQNP